MTVVYFGFFKQAGSKSLSPRGCCTKSTRSIIRDERGNVKVLITGEIDVYAQIQSYESGCNVHNIVKRALVDPSFLNFDPSLFGGSNEGIPSDVRGLTDYLNNCRDKYASLPPDVAKRFSCFDDFLSAFHDEKRIDDVFACFGKKRINTPESEVDNNVASE